MKGHKAAGWPKQPKVTSPQNRTGQAWKPSSVQVVAKRGEEIKVFDMPRGSFLCKKCNEIVRIDKRGFAACDKCGDIYNSGKEVIVPKKSKITMRSFIYKAFNKVE
jgi:ribosomal protein L37AE/L43A